MNRYRAGFTLVELLVTLTIFGIVAGSLVGLFVPMTAGYVSQTAGADLQQTVRAAADLMVRELRMTGFSSRSDTRFTIIEAEPNRVRFSVDWDDDGLITSSHLDNPSIFIESDLISYELDEESQSLRRITAEHTGDQSSQTLIGGSSDHMKMIDLLFTYFDHQGKETDELADIRSIGISFVAGTPAGRKGLLKQSHQTRVQCRNLGL
jgi:prepilin-type N-terminal cleavage/methylation domain-containing protein